MVTLRAPVAQLDRASDFESAGRPFESGRAHQKLESPLPQVGVIYKKVMSLWEPNRHLLGLAYWCFYLP